MADRYHDSFPPQRSFPLINIHLLASRREEGTSANSTSPRPRLVDVKRARRNHGRVRRVNSRDCKSTGPALLRRIAAADRYTRAAPEYDWHVVPASYAIARALERELEPTFIRLDISSLYEKEPCRMQLLLVLFFLPLLLLFLSFSIFRPDSKIIYRNGLGFLLDYFIFFFYRVTFRTRVFLRRKEIDIWEDFFRRKSRSLISNISIRNGIVITEFFLITDNLSIYVRWKIKSQKI